MKYSIKEYKMKNGIEGVAIIFEDDKYKLLSNFLQSDVLPFADWIKNDFDKVISGESNTEQVSGNVCFVEIMPKVTKVYNNLAEDDEEYYASCCEVNTKELRSLIDEWCDRVRKFKEKKCL